MATATGVQHALKGIQYPASKTDLMTQASDNGAEDDVIDTLDMLDADSYEGPDEVMSALKGQFDGDDGATRSTTTTPSC